MRYNTVSTEDNKTTYIVDNCQESLEVARHIKDCFEGKRLISLDGDVINAVSVAYKTASGLHSSTHGELTSNVYNMSKLSVATLIAQSDSSYKAFDFAAYELAKDAFKTREIDAVSKVLADASGRSVEECKALIEKKIGSMMVTMNLKSSKLDDEGNAPSSAQAVRDEILANPGKYLLSLYTGYGKTTLIHDPVIKSHIDAGKKVVVISHRRSINKNIANINGVVSYEDCKTPDVLENAKGLKIVVNSLSHPKFSSFIASADLVVIDEASQVIAHVLGGSVKENRTVWRTLESLVRNSTTVIMSDADIDSRCKGLIGEAKLFKIAQNHNEISVQIGDQNHVRSLILEAVKEVTVLVACDVAKDALSLGKMIEKECGFSPLVITAENSAWKEQAAFIADPNSTTHKVVIYSPVITSALSITSKHFSHHFGLFSGQVKPTDAIQMLRRDRNATSFTIGVKFQEYSKVEVVEAKYRDFLTQESAQKSKKAELKRALEAAGIQAEVIESVMAHDVFEDHSFERMEYEYRSSEAWLKDHIVRTLPATLSQQGFKVEMLEFNEELSKEGFKKNSAARKKLKHEIAAKLLSAKPAPEFVAKRVENFGSKDETEQFEVIRERAEKVTGKSYLSKKDALLFGDGSGEMKIKLFRDMQESSIDGIQALKSKIDEMDADKEVNLSEEDVVDLFDKINSSREDAIRFGLKLSRATSGQAKKAAVVSIFKQLGLGLKKREGSNKVKYYELNSESLALMKTYL